MGLQPLGPPILASETDGPADRWDPQTREFIQMDPPTHSPLWTAPLFPLPSHSRRCLSLASFPPAACPTGLSRPSGHLGRTGRGRGTGPSRDGGRGRERVVRAGEAGARAPLRPRAAPPPRLHHRPLTQCSTRASCCASASSTLTASRPTGERVGGALGSRSQAQDL